MVFLLLFVLKSVIFCRRLGWAVNHSYTITLLLLYITMLLIVESTMLFITLCFYYYITIINPLSKNDSQKHKGVRSVQGGGCLDPKTLLIGLGWWRACSSQINYARNINHGDENTQTKNVFTGICIYIYVCISISMCLVLYLVLLTVTIIRSSIHNGNINQ